jgi:predicted extracellular nuclease
MEKRIIKSALLFFVAMLIILSCSKKVVQQAKSTKENIFRVMFYNVENLFDTLDDPTKNDNDFLPESKKNWTDERLSHKLKQIAKVVESVGIDRMPDLIGLCEVENKKVLTFLLQRTQLKEYGYFIIHFDSPDPRGIDVALLYRKSSFRPEKFTYYPVVFKSTTERNTRDILYAKGKIPNGEHLHVFVNHWSSRVGGAEQSEHKRITASSTLRRVADSLFFDNRRSHILIMGDFNDYPDNKSVRETLKAETDSSATREPGRLYNLMAWQMGEGKGTYNYRNQWGFLDQFILSGSLLDNKSRTFTYFNQARAYREDFLLQGGKRNPEQIMPFSTYDGNKYLGGFSDHLPIFIDLHLKK